jgi:anti-sigma B factor antagonist
LGASRPPAKDPIVTNGTSPRAFALNVESADQRATVLVTGEVDLETSAALRTALLELANDGAQLVTVDLAETDFIDSTGLHALVVAMKQLREHGGDLVLRSPSRNAARVLELSGLATVVRIL